MAESHLKPAAAEKPSSLAYQPAIQHLQRLSAWQRNISISALSRSGAAYALAGESCNGAGESCGESCISKAESAILAELAQRKALAGVEEEEMRERREARRRKSEAEKQ